VLRIERRADVAVWTIDRPEARNALDHATLEALANAVRDAAADRALRAVVLTGAGETFISGGDLRELRDKSTRADAERFSDLGFDLLSALEDLPCPVVCALAGAAIGGGAELAIACDVRIAARGAVLAFKQVRMGVTTAWGTVPRLVALVGSGRAARLLYTARAVDADEAYAMGLVDAVVEPGEALAVALRWVEDIAAGAPEAVRGMKRLVRSAARANDETRALERALFAQTWSGPDHAEAVEAYFARRAPVFGSRRE